MDIPLPHVSEGDPHVPAHNVERDAILELNTEMETKIPFPPGAATGDLLRWDGTAWMTTETRFFEGNGSPNGVVAAPLGSRYIDKTNAVGIVEWIKTADGDSNTGWTSAADGTTILGRDRVEITRSGASLSNGGANQDAGVYAVPAGAKALSSRAYIKATVNGWASGNQDCAWTLQYQVAGGAWVTVDKVYRQNNGIAAQSLGATLDAFVDYPAVASQSLAFRLLADVAAGGSVVRIGGTGFSATFFK